jgi:hypothetical protein
MYGTEFKPGKPGRGVSVPLYRRGSSINNERHRAGPPATLEAGVKNLPDYA